MGRGKAPPLNIRRFGGEYCPRKRELQGTALVPLMGDV